MSSSGGPGKFGQERLGLTVLAPPGNDERARSALVWMLRRRWGLTAVRENARLLLDRLAFVGRGAGCAAARRAAAMGDSQAHARRAACAAVRRRVW